jgi:hypothetical protein
MTNPPLAATLLEYLRVDACGTTAGPSLAAAAGHHGVAPLLWSALGDAPAHASLRAGLHDAARAGTVEELLSGREVARVVAGCAEARLRVLLLKGAALAYTVYSEPWLRPRVDSDLLVDASHVPQAREVLERCGYSLAASVSTGTFVSHQWAFERVDPHGMRHVVDLHWRIANPQVLAHALSFDDLWRSSAPAPALGPAARVPSAVASLVLACIHRLAHHQAQERLIWLYDIHLLAEQLDDSGWNELRRWCERAHVAGLCADGLDRALRLFGSRVPAGSLRELAGMGRQEPSRSYLAGRVGRRDVLLSDLALLPGWRERLRLVREHAFPPAPFMLQRYGATRRVYLPLLYAHRLVTGAYKWIRA